MTTPRLPSLANPDSLVKALGKLHRRLADDLLKRAADPRIEPSIRDAWTADKKEGRTGEPYETYRDAFCDQVAASWILCTVFARTLEDRGFIPHRLAGPGAIERQTLFRSAFKFLGERDYLLHIFDGISLLPSAKEVFGRGFAPLWRLGPTNRVLGELLDELRSEENGQLRFTFGRRENAVDEAGSSTRFLGDLYQDLNEGVRKRFALLQTPDFVERFLLDHTLTPALKERGHAVTVLDPACGSGHLLLGAYDRLYAAWSHAESGRPRHELAKEALGRVYGIDLNPYAAAVARFRLLLSYLDKAGLERLEQAPEDVPLQVYVGDSLLAGRKDLQAGFGDLLTGGSGGFERTPVYSLFNTEADRLLYGTKFDVIVANPPYITEKDAAKRDLIRKQYKNSATGKYALSAPFAERIFELGKPGAYTGQITANSFMKREFGKGLVEKVLPNWDLTQVIDTSGAFIPGHGTPTVILFGRSSPKGAAKHVPVVMGIRGEPTTPEDPAKGKVWSAIEKHHQEIGFENEFISVAEVEREKLAKHPWSIGGGGASELKELLEERAGKRLNDLADSIGISAVTGEDDVYLRPKRAYRHIGEQFIRPLIEGDLVRDWAVAEADYVFFPYDQHLERLPIEQIAGGNTHLWPYKHIINKRKRFGVPMLQRGLTWYELQELYADKLRTTLAITFAFVATHNHFVLDRGGKVFKQTAPIVKLKEDATEDAHLSLLGYLNSSTACFWMKQVCTKKGEGGGARVAGGFSIMGSEEWKNNFEFSSTALLSMPIFAERRNLSWTRAIVEQCATAIEYTPQYAVPRLLAHHDAPTTLHSNIDQLRAKYERCRMIACALQEELDWITYASLGFQVPTTSLTPDTINELDPSCRPVEILLARQVRQGEKTEWFDRFCRKPHTLEEACAKYPAHADVIQKRMELIAQHKELQLLERPEYKRRWEPFDWNDAVKQACTSYLLTQAETFFQSREPRGYPVRAIATELVKNDKVRAVAEVLTGNPQFDLEILLADLMLDDAVPSATCQIYTDQGIETRRLWEKVWDLQRKEDAGQKVEIEPPPKYDQKDFENAATLWRLRGKLDVPKERFIAYPTATPPPGATGKPGLVFGWAGWDALKKLQAAIELWQEEMGLHAHDLIPKATREKIAEADLLDERLLRDFNVRHKVLPILQTMVDLVPWVSQWHDEDGQTASAFGAYIAEESRKLEVTEAEVHGYRRPGKVVVPKARRSGTAGKNVADTIELPEEDKPKRGRRKKA